jgi:hypothetical protein
MPIDRAWVALQNWIYSIFLRRQNRVEKVKILNFCVASKYELLIIFICGSSYVMIIKERIVEDYRLYNYELV